MNVCKKLTITKIDKKYHNIIKWIAHAAQHYVQPTHLAGQVRALSFSSTWRVVCVRATEEQRVADAGRWAARQIQDSRCKAERM
jgi:hypothetical protein